MNNGLHNKSFCCLTDIPASAWAEAQVAALCSHQQLCFLIKVEVEILGDGKLAKQIFPRG